MHVHIISNSNDYGSVLNNVTEWRKSKKKFNEAQNISVTGMADEQFTLISKTVRPPPRRGSDQTHSQEAYGAACCGNLRIQWIFIADLYTQGSPPKSHVYYQSVITSHQANCSGLI